MKLSEAALIMKGGLRGEDGHFFGASSDTRKIKPGELFFAWEGEQFDAHDFLESAETKGAIAAVVERYVNSAEIPQIQVKDAQLALGRLAAAWRARWKGTIIALTGSNGKTTLKEMIATLLTEVAPTLATVGNYNNHVGCPLTLLHLGNQHQYGVIEMGANHFGEIEYLTTLAAPDIAIINNAGACHLEGFGSIAGVAKAKGEIFTGLAADGVAIINRDDEHYDYWATQLEETKQRYYSFGYHQEADLRVVAEASAGSYTFIDQSIAPEEATLQLNLLGAHNGLNAAAATLVGRVLGIDFATITGALEGLKPVAGRLEQISLTKEITLINDGYNANPNSLKAGIEALPSGEEHWVVLGEMRELGPQGRAIHQECGLFAAKAGVSKLFGLGALAAAAVTAFNGAKEGSATDKGYYPNHEALLQALQEAITTHQAAKRGPLSILIKGSNSMNMGYFIDQLTGESLT